MTGNKKFYFYTLVGDGNSFSLSFIIRNILINHRFNFIYKLNKLNVSPSYCGSVFGLHCKSWLHEIVYTVQHLQCSCCVPGGQWNSEGLVLSLILNGRLKRQSLCL